jgi:cobalt-zinc-cadmium resistance protein CzcA
MQAARIIKQFPEVKIVVGKTGSAEVPTDPMPPEATDIIIVLKPESEWREGVTFNGLADEISEALEVIPGVFFEKNQPIQMRFNELMTGIRQDVAVKIFGENMDTLLNYANQVSAVVQRTEGATQPSVERVEGLPQITIKYNRAQIANYGLNISDVNHVVSTAFAGEAAGLVYENERRFDLVVRLDSAHRSNMDDVSHLFIPTANGAQIPLSQLADIKMQLGAAQISREAGKRRIVIGFNVKGRDVQSVVEDIQGALDKSVKLPSGYYFTYGGTFENLQAASKRLMVAVPIALALIFILLYFTFTSLKESALIFTAIPMSAIGGIFALLARDMPFSISAGVGFIALFGVAVLNGIVLISTFNQLEKEGVEDIIDRVLQGTKIRLRPVLMTATVASLGFLPMALSHGAGAEVQKPLATVVIGGLVSATFLTLFVLPLLYLIFNVHGKKKGNTAPVITTLLLFLLATGANAQGTGGTSLSVEQAVDMAVQNNMQIQSGQLNVEAYKVQRKAVFELPKANFNIQYGQYNSINQDIGFQLSQSIPFPTYYAAKAGVYKAQYIGSELQRQVTVNQVKAEVRSLYYELQYRQNVGVQMGKLDSVYNAFLNAANLRYQTGETNLLEKSTAEAKRAQLSLLVRQNESEYTAAYKSLKALMNTADDFTVPATGFQPLTLTADVDTIAINSNPAVQYQYQQAIIAQQNKRLEIASALPDLNIGYFNQSLMGTQNIDGNDVYFGREKRFQGLNAGISIPLTAFSNAAKVKSLRYQAESLQKSADYNKQQLQVQLETALIKYRQQLAYHQYYNEVGLRNYNDLINTAHKQYQNGEIGYVEYLQALQTATDIQLSYLQNIDQLSQSIIQINFLTSK